MADGGRGDEPTRGLRDQARETNTNEERAGRRSEGVARTKGGQHAYAIMAAVVLLGAQGGARWETWVGENHGMNADETMDHNGPSAGDNGAGN